MMPALLNSTSSDGKSATTCFANASLVPPRNQLARSSILFDWIERGTTMKKMFVFTAAASLAALAACNNTPQEQAADNIEANSEAVADNLEDAADNVSTEAASDGLENKADAVRATGQNQADDMRTNDPDTNLSNGI